MPKKKTHEEYIEELKIINPNIKVIGSYINSYTKILHKCKMCGHEWDAKPHNILNGTGCPICAFKEQKKKTTRTHDEYVKELKIKNPNVEVIDRYINANTNIMHHCLIHDIFWLTKPCRVLEGHGCEQCRIDKFRESNTKTQDKYIEELHLINPDIEVIGRYVDAKTKILHKCLLHNIVWMAAPTNVLKGCGCKECLKDKISNKNIKMHEKYVEDLMDINPNIIVLEEYVGANIKITHKRKICGHQWKVQPSNLLSGRSCPKCYESYGEKSVSNYLCKNDIFYIPQHTFYGCKDKRELPFDFYLPELNICIEYQGKQHYESVDYFGGEKSLAYIQYHDKIKSDYCKSNNVKLICIPYWEDVDKYLNKNLLI